MPQKYKAKNKKTGEVVEFDFNGIPTKADINRIISERKRPSVEFGQLPNRDPLPTFGPNRITPPKIDNKIPEYKPKSTLRKAWDWGTTSLVPGLTEPTQEEWASNPSYSAKRSLGMNLTTPLAVAGEAVGAIGILSKLRGWNKAATKVAPKLDEFPTNKADEFTDIMDDSGRIIGKEKILPKVKTGPGNEFQELPTFKELIEPSPVSKINEALRRAKPARKLQEKMYTAERAERIGKVHKIPLDSEAAANKRLGALSGEYDKIDFEPLKLEQPDIDGLFKTIGNKLNDGFDQVHASTGLKKLFGGKVPQDSELRLLTNIFGDDFGEFASELPKHIKYDSKLLEAINLPKGIWSGLDLSAPLRQGKTLIHRKEYWTSLDDMFKSAWSEEGFKAVQDSIRDTPKFALKQKSRLAMTDLKGLSNREEATMSTWAEKYIPGIRASNRAYTAFLNKLRSDTFDSMLDKAIKSGRNEEDAGREIASFINNFTGRGHLGRFEKVAVEANVLLFSPRFIKSRLHILSSPYTYLKADPLIQKEVLKSLFSFTGVGMMQLELAKMMGAEVGLNPTSSDFGKIKIGNVRMDVWAGFQQYARLAAQLYTGETTSPVTGKVTQLGEGYRAKTRAKILADFGKQKLAPVPAFVVKMLEGKDFAGKPLNLGKEAIKGIAPNLSQTIYELMKEDPKLLPLTIPAAFGEGIQVFDEAAPIRRNRRLPGY